MKLIIFGLTVSSSWGNGHATLWRALIGALGRRGHKVVFFERDVPYYAAHRDMWALGSSGDLKLYSDWADNAAAARRELDDCDAAIVTSYCPDGIAAAQLVLDSPTAVKVFYDLDTPVTLWRLGRGEELEYLEPAMLRDFDLVLSYTGGAALEQLQRAYGARAVAPLYGHVDPRSYRPVEPVDRYRADLSYLGTYAEDRQEGVRQLLVEPARRRPQQRFLIGGAQYPQSFPWTDNIYFVRHLPPAEHPAFFCSSRLTLNVTRQAMAEMGYCPSGRLFEAAACGTPIISDAWDGLESFFAIGHDLLIARHTEDVLTAMNLSDRELRAVGEAGRQRVLSEHTADHRAAELERMLETAAGTGARASPTVAKS